MLHPEMRGRWFSIKLNCLNLVFARSAEKFRIFKRMADVRHFSENMFKISGNEFLGGGPSK